MSKDPAFLFYPGDYLRDTQCLSEKTQVAYDRIICEHMRNICISQMQLNFFTKRLSPEEVDELLTVLKKVEGGFQIEWVAESISKRKAYGESRRKNRTKKEKDMNNISETYVKHMENENENENEKNIEGCGEKKEKEVTPPSEGEKLYSRSVKLFPSDMQPKTEKQKTEWIDTLDKLIRIEEAKPEEIFTVIDRTRADPFWQKNFLSVLKLRKKNDEGIMYYNYFKNRINGSSQTNSGRQIERVNDFWNKES